MGRGRPKKSLDITAQERADLEAICASRSLPIVLVRRARMILLTESGVPAREQRSVDVASFRRSQNWLKTLMGVANSFCIPSTELSP